MNVCVIFISLKNMQKRCVCVGVKVQKRMTMPHKHKEVSNRTSIWFDEQKRTVCGCVCASWKNVEKFLISSLFLIHMMIFVVTSRAREKEKRPLINVININILAGIFLDNPKNEKSQKSRRLIMAKIKKNQINRYC